MRLGSGDHPLLFMVTPNENGTIINFNTVHSSAFSYSVAKRFSTFSPFRFVFLFCWPNTMGVGKIASMLGLLLTHPNDFRTLLQFYLFHTQKRDITAQREHPTSGWDRQSMRRCWEFLDLTSRSFAAVIKEVDGDLARTVRIYVLFLNMSHTFFMV